MDFILYTTMKICTATGVSWSANSPCGIYMTLESIQGCYILLLSLMPLCEKNANFPEFR